MSGVFDVIARRDEFGVGRVFFDDAGRIAPALRDLVDDGATADAVFVRAHLLGNDDEHRARTLVRGVQQLPAATALVRGDDGALVVVPSSTTPRPQSLAATLRAAVAKACASSRVALALSGGLDSAVLLALVRELRTDVVCFVLHPQMQDYSEREAALRTAAVFDAEVVVVDRDEAGFVAALPRALRAFEVPIFNAHPVARVLLAEALRAAGITDVITGDGADHVYRRDRSANYLPLMQAACDSAGVRLHAPFLDVDVIAHLFTQPADAHKPELRALGRDLGVVATLVEQPKRARLAPPLDLDEFVAGFVSDDDLAAAAACAGIDLVTSFVDDRQRMRWLTTSFLLKALGLRAAPDARSRPARG